MEMKSENSFAAMFIVNIICIHMLQKHCVAAVHQYTVLQIKKAMAHNTHMFTLLYITTLFYKSKRLCHKMHICLHVTEILLYGCCSFLDSSFKSDGLCHSIK